MIEDVRTGHRIATEVRPVEPDAEPDDVDFVVGDVPPADRASIETERFIEAYKRRLEYRLEAEEAARILDALGIDAHDSGMPDAETLLDHWRRCIADLSQ